MEFDWHLNLLELKKVCKTLSVQTSGYYVELDDVKKVMQMTDAHKVRGSCLKATQVA
ncbi:hypothetical protein ABEW03_12010 [Virgibacillus pantothenticus]|uniref:hypothetical protein n=1 Tax=Virgibacillus pantothenticus TaxID=1473 RepID=UPI003D2C5371